MIALENVPTGYDELIARYGNPCAVIDVAGHYVLDKIWYKDNIGTVTLPYPMRLSWATHKQITAHAAHRLIIPTLEDAYAEILAHKGLAYLQDNEYDRWGGCFNFRVVRGGTAMSTHCWAIAVDINPHLGPLGEESRQPEFILNAFVKRGFVWGGTFARKDGMHYQAVKGY